MHYKANDSPFDNATVEFTILVRLGDHVALAEESFTRTFLLASEPIHDFMQ